MLVKVVVAFVVAWSIHPNAVQAQHHSFPQKLFAFQSRVIHMQKRIIRLTHWRHHFNAGKVVLAKAATRTIGAWLAFISMHINHLNNENVHFSRQCINECDLMASLLRHGSRSDEGIASRAEGGGVSISTIRSF